MIVIPMAGLSSRFTKAGYREPKWRLPLGDRPLLDWSLLSFEHQFATEPFLIPFLSLPGTREFIESRVAALGIRQVQLIPLPQPTGGQAETVHQGLEAASVPDAEALTIFNIDTIRLGYQPDVLIGQCDGLVECFRGEGEHWSFVQPRDERSRSVARVAEKTRISDLCSTGLYYFRSAGLFRAMFSAERESPTMPELYVAPLYQRMVDSGMDVRYSVIPADEVVFSGTPDEYTAAKNVVRRLEDRVGR